MNRDVEKLRAAIVASLATLTIGICVSFADMPLIDAERQVLAGNNIGAFFPAPWRDLLYYSWLAVYALAHVLALALVRLARHAFAAAFALVILMPAVGGMSVGSAWDSTAWALHMVVLTFAVGLLFFAPGVSQRFRAKDA